MEDMTTSSALWLRAWDWRKQMWKMQYWRGIRYPVFIHFHTEVFAFFVIKQNSSLPYFGKSCGSIWITLLTFVYTATKLLPYLCSFAYFSFPWRRSGWCHIWVKGSNLSAVWSLCSLIMLKVFFSSFSDWSHGAVLCCWGSSTPHVLPSGHSAKWNR